MGQVDIAFYYFESCPAQKQALADLKAVLSRLSLSANFDFVCADETWDQRTPFPGSPSIYLNGRDIDRDPPLPSAGLSCRIYCDETGRFSAIPPGSMIGRALESAIQGLRFGDGSLRSDPLLNGLRLFNQGEFFECHEVWEDAWRAEDGPLKDLYQGLIKAAVAFYHAQRENYEGAAKVMRSGLPQLRPYALWPGLDLVPFILEAEDWLGEFVHRQQMGGRIQWALLPRLHLGTAPSA